MRDAGGGSYVHLGSAGHLWFPQRDGLSVVPKAANEAFVKGIAKEEGRHNIRANSVLVGVIEAGMFLELTKRGVFDQAWIDETHRSEEHTSELQSLMRISYAVFCLKKKNINNKNDQ